MHLQNHAGPEGPLGELTVDGDHCQLDEVGSRALQWCVDGCALCKSALVRIAALDVWNGSHTPEHRPHRALSPRLIQCLLYKRSNACVALEIPLDISLGLRLRNAQLRGEPERRDPVDNAKVDGLRAPASLLVHSVCGD